MRAAITTPNHNAVDIRETTRTQVNTREVTTETPFCNSMDTTHNHQSQLDCLDHPKGMSTDFAQIVNGVGPHYVFLSGLAVTAMTVNTNLAERKTAYIKTV